LPYVDRTRSPTIVEKTKAERWDANFESVRKFYQDYGRWPVLRDVGPGSRGSTGAKLGVWCNTQKMSKKGKGTSKISPEQIARLDAIGFDWGTPSGERWNRSFEAVREFHRLNGRWPTRKDGALGGWCQTQRQAKKKGRISPAQIAKLGGIGFDWGFTETAEERWDRNFEAAKEFRRLNGRWPPQSGGPIGAWCATQRKARNNTGNNRVSPAQIARLDAIGFDWGTTKTMTADEWWDDRLRAVEEYHRLNGRWPPQSERPLGAWSDHQRQARKNPGPRTISQERIAKLDAIGFDWGTAAPPPVALSKGAHN
jgi:hypothetical protein